MPLLGLTVSRDCTLLKAGEFNGAEMHGVAVRHSYFADEKFRSQTPRRLGIVLKVAFIENRECEDSVLIVLCSAEVPEEDPFFPDVRVDRWCRLGSLCNLGIQEVDGATAQFKNFNTDE